MVLIVGATGLVGSEICRLLAAQGVPLRALIRSTSNADRVSHLRSLGAELVTGDLKDRGSLAAVCRDVTTVMSTASSTIARQEGDSIETVDGHGQINLIDVAESAGVRHFVLISFPSIEREFPLQTAKRAAEDRLRRSRMTFTILQPTCFMEVWLSPALGFDPANGSARIYGSGNNKTSWISFRDVARFAVAALDNAAAANATITLGGPDALSPLEVVRLVEQVLGKTIDVQHVPEVALQAQFDAATDSLQKSFAALMLYYARGDVVDLSEATRILRVDHLQPVRHMFQAAV